MLTPTQFQLAFTSLILATRSGVVDVLCPFYRERMMAEVPRKALKTDLSESHFTFLRLIFFIWNMGIWTTNSEFFWEFREIMNVKCLEYCRCSNMRARLSVNWGSEKGPDLSKGKGLRGNFPPLNLSISDFLVHGKSHFLPRAEPLLSSIPTHWARIISPQIPVYLIDNIPEVIR